MDASVILDKKSPDADPVPLFTINVELHVLSITKSTSELLQK